MTKSRRFDERVTVRLTEAMLADLQVIATKTKLPIPAIIRTAIRNYLDGTDLTLGTRRTFDRRFQRRMDELEEWLILLLAVSTKHFSREYEGKRGGDLMKELLLSGEFPQMVRRAQEIFREGKKYAGEE